MTTLSIRSHNLGTVNQLTLAKRLNELYKRNNIIAYVGLLHSL